MSPSASVAFCAAENRPQESQAGAAPAFARSQWGPPTAAGWRPRDAGRETLQANAVTAEEQFEHYLKKQALRATASRRAVLYQAAKMNGHFDAEQLAMALRQARLSVGRST